MKTVSFPSVLSCTQRSRIRFLIKMFLSRTKRDDGAENHSLVTVPNIPALNPQALCNSHGMQAYILLIPIYQFGGDLKPGVHLDVFQKSRINADTRFPLNPFTLHINHSYNTLRNTTDTYTFTLDTSKSTFTNHPTMWPAERSAEV